MATHISDERNELQEDDEKLQAALHEFVDQWDEDDDDYSEEDEDQLLIDLDYENSEQTVNSASSSFVGSATQSRSFTAADDESQDVVPRPDIQLPTQVGVAEESADPWKTLNLNRALQDILNTHIESILEALRENKEKQAKLEEDSVDNSSKAVPKSTSAGPFRAPYFRQGNSYPEPNEDVLQKKRSADYDAVKVEFMKDLRYPKKGARTILKDAVLEDQLERLLKPIVTQMEAEIKKRDKVTEEFDATECSFESEVKRLKELQSQPQDSSAELMIKEVKKTIRVLEKAVEEKRKLIEEHKEIVTRLEQEIEQKRSTPVEELLAAVEIDKVDWMKIAKQNFDNYTWLDCQKAWENLVSPAVNNASWTKEEDEKLLNLVKNSETWDWQKTAKELRRGRTPFQCFSRYQQRCNPDLKPRPWTEKEDAKLIKVTTNVKDSVGFFSWAKVSALIDSRSPLECMSRFTRVDPSQSRGRWTSLEDAKLIAAVEMIGPCWAKISKFIGSRNMVQCRDRYINCLAPNINFSHFTYDEDIKLLRLYKANGPAWSKMIPEFIGRTDSMIMGRFRQLKKWKQQNEWFNRQSNATKRMLLGKSLTVAERQKFLSKTTDYLHQQLGVIPEDYKRQELDRQNGVDPDIIPPRPPRHLRCYAFGGSKRDGGLNKWQKKLELHKRLTENLHRLLEKEIEATSNKGKKGGKSATKLSEEVAQEIMNESVAATLRDQNNVRKLVRKKGKGQVKKLEAALNKAFLHAGTISVQELLQSSMADKKKMEPIEKYIRVESELKSILRRRGRTLSKLGRARRFFERDTRPVKVIEDELDELDISVPLMLMKGFGSDIHYLHNAARLRSLQIHEELSEQPAYEEDEDFQQEEANAQEAIQKVLARTDITDSYRQHQISILNSKLKSLRKIHKEKRFLNSKVIENKINTFQDDLDYLESLDDEKREMEVNKNLALMACNPQGSLGTEFDSEMEVFSTPVGSDNTRSSDTPSSSQVQSSSGHQSEVGRDEASRTVENSVFAVPALPGEKKRKRFSTRILSNTTAGEKSFQKKFRALTKEEIAQEKRKISTVRKKVYTKLPFLPPNLSTLLSLRALLLMKQKLIDRAGLLYKPEGYSRRPRLEIDIAEEDESIGINLQEENQTVSSGSWFLNTHPQQLAEQARQFKGFVSHRGNQRSSAVDEPEFDLPTERIRYGRKHRPDHSAVSFESDTLVFPLEERGGAVSSKRKINHNSEADSKPVILEPTHASEYTNAQSKSCYEVVMSYAGDYSINAPPAKEMSKGPRLAQTTAPRLNKTAAVGKYDDTLEASENSICIVPSTTIKTDEGTPLVSVSCIVNKGSSEIASESHREGVMQKIIDVPSVSETKHIVRCEEDDDVVAVIHLDDDEDDDLGHARTVIDLRESYSGSRAPANTGGRNIVDSDDDETSMFTLSVQPQKASQLSELTRMELPESRVNRIMRNHRLRDRKSDVVLVDIDKDSKSIIHFKSNKDKFTAFEAVSTNTAETRVGHQRRVYTSEDEKEKFIPDYMSVLRQTKEYKMLLARFHALFMWPVLISTIEPSPLNDGSLPTMLNTYSAWLEQNSRKRPRRKKRVRTKRSLIMRKHLQNIRDSSLEARRKRFLDQMAQELGEPAENIDEGAEMADREDADANVTNVTTQDDENDDEANEEAKASAVSEEVKKRRVRRKRKVKPIRVRDKKYDEILRKKSRPVIEADQEGLQPEEAGSKVLPQWWRDAVLAAMVAKKTMADDGEEDTVVNIEEDEDFIDKGNYSDDEWYQELRTEEDKKNVKGRRKKRTVSNSQEGQHVVEDSTAGHDL